MDKVMLRPESNAVPQAVPPKQLNPAGWQEFWNGTHSIYVSQKHKNVHYFGVAKEIGEYSPGPEAQILDYGCGEALGSHILSFYCGTLSLYDTSPRLQAQLKQNFATNPRIEVINEHDLQTAPKSTYDMIICNSVLQYTGPAEFEYLLSLWREKLKPDGFLLIADVIPPNVSALKDAKALLNFAWQHGFFFPALLGLCRTFFSSYRKLRSDIGLTTYTEKDFREILRQAGFAVRRAEKNIGHNQARMTFVAAPVWR